MKQKGLTKPVLDIYFDDDYDKVDSFIEFYIDSKHTLSISINPSGDITWAYLWGEYSDHGSGNVFKRENN